MLDVTFEERTSGYIGDYYRAPAGVYTGGELKVTPNEQDDFGEPVLSEPGFPEHAFLLQVNTWPDPDGVRRTLATLPAVDISAPRRGARLSEVSTGSLAAR